MATCTNCNGIGYFDVPIDGDIGIELERCDECEKFTDDDSAAVQFTRDLAGQIPEAMKIARYFMERTIG